MFFYKKISLNLKIVIICQNIFSTSKKNMTFIGKDKNVWLSKKSLGNLVSFYRVDNQFSGLLMILHTTFFSLFHMSQNLRCPPEALLVYKRKPVWPVIGKKGILIIYIHFCRVHKLLFKQNSKQLISWIKIHNRDLFFFFVNNALYINEFLCAKNMRQKIRALLLSNIKRSRKWTYHIRSLFRY